MKAIRCADCRHAFASGTAVRVLAGADGQCPFCGGRLELIDRAAEQQPASHPAAASAAAPSSGASSEPIPGPDRPPAA